MQTNMLVPIKCLEREKFWIRSILKLGGAIKARPFSLEIGLSLRTKGQWEFCCAYCVAI